MEGKEDEVGEGVSSVRGVDGVSGVGGVSSVGGFSGTVVVW